MRPEALAMTAHFARIDAVGIKSVEIAAFRCPVTVRAAVVLMVPGADHRHHLRP